MRRVPQSKKKPNKFIFPFVIILILLTIFIATIIISYNVMNPGTGEPAVNQQEEYQQPENMLGSKTEEDKLKDLRDQNAELKKQVSDLEVENAQLRAELETLTATLENQSFVQQNGSSSDDDTPTSETGI